MHDLWQRLEPEALGLGGRLLGVFVILALGSLAMHYLVGPLRRLLDRSRLEPAAASFAINSVRALLLLALLLAVLQQLGVQTTSLLALLGAAGLAIALSLQGSLANFASGLILLAFHIVRLNDLIEVGDVRGRVCELLPFHVVVETADNQRVTLPNNLLIGGPVRNHSALPTHRLQWTIPVASRVDLAVAKEALRSRLRAEPRLLAEPAPRVFVQEWGDERRVVAVQAWVRSGDIESVQQEVLEELGRTVEALPHETTSGGGPSP
jgi:small conductance mechanosensitive channel